jgi:hypothetical protein
VRWINLLIADLRTEDELNRHLRNGYYRHTVGGRTDGGAREARVYPPGWTPERSRQEVMTMVRETFLREGVSGAGWRTRITSNLFRFLSLAALPSGRLSEKLPTAPLSDGNSSTRRGKGRGRS